MFSADKHSSLSHDGEKLRKLKRGNNFMSKSIKRFSLVSVLLLTVAFCNRDQQSAFGQTLLFLGPIQNFPHRQENFSIASVDSCSGNFLKE